MQLKTYNTYLMKVLVEYLLYVTPKSFAKLNKTKFNYFTILHTF